MEYLYRTILSNDLNCKGAYDNSNYNNDNNVKLVNKAFSALGLHELFSNSDNDWYLTKNELNHICYTRRGYETDCFEIIIQKDKIYVCIPIKNSIFQFKTSFKDYTRAYYYLENRFYDFNDMPVVT